MPRLNDRKLETYKNDKASYRRLVDVVARLRVQGGLAWGAIHDPTRPRILHHTDKDVSAFMGREIDNFLTGYQRDLQQSQPYHIEVAPEKNTLNTLITPIARRYAIPGVILRGFSSLDPLHELAQQFRKSGKERLVLQILSDFDPDGVELAHSTAVRLRDDFDIAEKQLTAIRVGLTREQVAQFRLPPNMDAKENSPNYRRFVAQYGRSAYELEAIPPQERQLVLDQLIRQVIDIEAFNQEIDAERQDAAYLETKRAQVKQALLDEIPPDLEFPDIPGSS